MSNKFDFLTRTELESQYAEYDVDNTLDSQVDEDMFDEIFNYSDSEYICDTIQQIADDNVSIYNSTLCNECWNLYAHGSYEDAHSEGLMGDSGDLIKNLQIAWYYYNSEQLQRNVEELIWNYAIKYIIDNSLEVTQEDMDNIEDDLIRYVDHNDKWYAIHDIINEVITQRNEDEE